MPSASDFLRFFTQERGSLRRSISALWTIMALTGLLIGRSASALGSPTDFQAQEPSPEDISQAAKYFDQGRDAFRQETYVEAAESFEKADALAPNAKVLLLAIQSRELAGQLGRAATLAALAQQRHPKDPLFNDVGDLLKSAKDKLHLVVVTCESPCRITVGDRLVHGAPATRRYLFLEEGNHRIRASWGQGRGLARLYQATPGARGKLSFAAEPVEEDDWDEQSEEQSGAAEERSSGGELPADAEDWGDGSDWGDPPDDPLESSPRTTPSTDADDGGGADPLVFWSGVALTGVLVGVSTWSGIDTLNNPGKDAVVAKCVGLGESCPEYQEGLSNQLRTNVLWGVTGGIGIVTALVGAFWTDWDGHTPASQAGVRLDVRPLVTQAHRSEWHESARAVRLDGSMITASGRF